MPGLINRFPRGLLGLLDAKTNGKTPEGLADLVVPTLDMLPYYEASMREIVSDATAAVAGVGAIFGAAALLTVPNDQLWRVQSLNVASSVALAAGETLGLIPIARARNVGGVATDTDLASPQTAGQGPTLWARAVSQEPFWALPGDQLGAFVYHRVAYAGTVSLVAKFSRLLI